MKTYDKITLALAAMLFEEYSPDHVQRFRLLRLETKEYVVQQSCHGAAAYQEFPDFNDAFAEVSRLAEIPLSHMAECFIEETAEGCPIDVSFEREELLGILANHSANLDG